MTNRSVPYGLVLGPLLFLVYIGDMLTGLDNDVKYLVYADDLPIYFHCPSSDLPSTLRKHGANATVIGNRVATNNLALNIGNTKAIFLVSYYYLNQLEPNQLSVLVNARLIPIETSIRNLGVSLDAKMMWKEHIRSISSKDNTVMYKLNHFRRSINFDYEKILYKLYCSPWSNIARSSFVMCQMSLTSNLREYSILVYLILFLLICYN